MSHADLTACTARLQKDSIIELEVDRAPHGRCKIRLQIEQAPKRGFVGRAQVLARFCDRCSEWHHTEDGRIALPELGTHYFRVDFDPPVPLEGDAATDECRFEDAGSDIDETELDDDPEEAADTRAWSAAVEAERQCAGTIAAASVGDLRADFMTNKYIYNEKPSHVQWVVWNQYAPATRKAHIRWLNRIKAMPEDMHHGSLASALLDLLLRMSQEKEKAWAWSTIAGHLATIKAAFKGLPVYTNQKSGIDLEKDYMWRQAEMLANRQAKTKVAEPKDSEPLTYDRHLQMCAKDLATHIGAWCMQQLNWCVKGRAGDTRRLYPENITIAPAADETGQVPIFARFTEGKGARFWGPFTIHSHLPTEVAKPVREYLASRPRGSHAFTTGDQRLISKSVAQWKNHSLRSIRRGALVHMSECGVKLTDLIKVSGHKRMDTLLRYLGWGERDGEAIQSAQERSRLVVAAHARRRNAPTGGAMDGQPMAVGVHSGLNGPHGRRTREPMPFFIYHAASARELGTLDDEKIDRSAYPLHLKSTGTIEYERLTERMQSDEFRTNLRKATSFLTSSEHYGITWPTMVEQQIPFSSFTTEHALQFLRFGKCRPLREGEVIYSYAKGFLQPNDTKLYFRPVFEPFYNNCINRDQLPEMRYPSEAEKRFKLCGKKYIMLFDFKAWYDQLPLDDAVHNCHVIRLKEPVEWEGKLHTLLALTKDPMGATHSAHTAQTITWAIGEPLFHMNVDIVTMIDNFIVATDDPEAFVQAVQTFIQRCDEFGAVLNDRESYPSDPAAILKMGRETASTWTSILGAEYKDGLVRNTEKNLKNLNDAYLRLQRAASDPSVVVTRRHIAALISLAFYMARIIDVRVAQHFPMIRLHQKMSSMRGSWDSAYKPSINEMNNLAKLVGIIMPNVPVRPTLTPLPGSDFSDYDATIIFDASATGYGAWVLMDGTIYEVRSGWRNTMRFSAHAEPTAGKEVIAWVRARCKGRIAVVTDHIAMAMAQRRPISGNGGFSTAFPLNEFFVALYGEKGDLLADVFHCEGVKNPTDGISRSNRIGDPFRFTVNKEVTFPPLSSFHHPYRCAPRRAWWNV